MAQESIAPFEFDEPASQSHTPPNWSIETLEIKPSGKAPKHCGPNAYRFAAALTLSVILPRRGWTLVKKTKNYVYLIPPADNSRPPFLISIAVPTADECLEIARRSYARGSSWMGQLGEWPAWYLQERNKDMQKLSRDPDTGTLVAEVVEQPPESSLSIGEWGAWSAEVTGIDGNFVVGHLPPMSPRDESTTAGGQPLSEGTPREVELTIYERNPTACRLCLEHFGPTCQACGLNYEDKYGPIGADLIHVHHLTPLAAIGETYEVDPIRDLVPLCATCHHVVHRRSPPFLVTEIKDAIETQLRLRRGQNLQ